jgi:hypothetical protein
MKNPLVLGLLLALHLGVSTKAVLDHGYFELYAFALRDWPQFQIFVDLGVAVVLANVLVIKDARANGRNPWPYVVSTAAVGSLAPLMYFVVGAIRERWPAK